MTCIARLRAVIFGVTILIGAHALHAESGPAVQWAFGTYPEGKDHIVRAVAIPWKVGTKYGYEVEVSSSKPSIVVKEELILPEPAHWKTSGPAAKSPLISNHTSEVKDGRIAVQEQTLDVSLPVQWRKTYEIIEGDPEGVHIVRLFIDGKLERETEFRIYKEGPPETAWRNAILEGANASIIATMEGDLQAVAKLTYPVLIELLGGEEKMCQEMAATAVQVKKKLLEGRRSFSIGEPTPPVSANGKLFSVIPTQMLSISQGGRSRIYLRSYLLAISTDAGTTWKFLDGTGLTPSIRAKVVPELPATLALPKVEGPTIKDVL